LISAIPQATPGSGLAALAGQIWATLRAEITMQWRRRGLWLAFGCTAILLLFISGQAAIYLHMQPPSPDYQNFTDEQLDNVMIYAVTVYGALFLDLVAALLVADRIDRDYRSGMYELQRATPQGCGRYLVGKILGNYLAIFVPSLLVYIACALTAIVLGWSWAVLAKFLQAFLLVFVPSSLVAVSLIFLLVSFLPLRVAQIGFALFWLYFNLPLGWYVLSASLFNTAGLYILPVFFPVPPWKYSTYNVETSMDLALINIGLQLVCAAVFILLTYGALVYRQHRKEVA
jgi:hypothetical protein